MATKELRLEFASEISVHNGVMNVVTIYFFNICILHMTIRMRYQNKYNELHSMKFQYINNHKQFDTKRCNSSLKSIQLLSLMKMVQNVL